MEPRAARGSGPGAGGCPACGAGASQVDDVLLANRSDLSVVERRCRRCGSLSLSLVLGPDEARPGPAHPGLVAIPGPLTGAASPAGSPISLDDVERMRRFLAQWSGDLASLVDPPGLDGPVAP